MENKKIEKGIADENVFYLGGIPTIAICPDCNEFAKYSEGDGLLCPRCGNADHLSEYVWDKNSRHPEE